MKCALQAQKMIIGLKFIIQEEEGFFNLCSEKKGADWSAVTMQLICVFVFIYEKSRFSHDMAQFISIWMILYFILYDALIS